MSRGHDRAQIGSGLSHFVIVRSIDGRTVVDSDAVFVTPTFLMLPWTVAVLNRLEPADAMTYPLTVIVRVPPALRDRIEQTASAAFTTQPRPVPTVPLTTVWLTIRLEASRPWNVSLIRTSSAREVAVFATWTT